MWAVVEHLHRGPDRGPRTLFATHYQELTQLEKHLPRLHNFSVAVKEWNDEIVFVRRVIAGAAHRSYGIQVARLAGLPLRVIDRAKAILAKVESDDATVRCRPRKPSRRKNHSRIRGWFAAQLAVNEVHAAERLAIRAPKQVTREFGSAAIRSRAMRFWQRYPLPVETVGKRTVLDQVSQDPPHCRVGGEMETRRRVCQTHPHRIRRWRQCPKQVFVSPIVTNG